ncbi:hypothetical protein O3S80_21420 [Streptomyces sp. Lzd4kr]|nr:hypothetical protein [Streptomyces sp. Lzd4kr]
MGRIKAGKPRRNRPDHSLVEKMADAYSCGHCHSAVGWSVDEHGVGHVNVHHDTGCPVLGGTLPDAPDMLRATEGTDGIVFATPTGKVIAVVHPGCDEGGSA